MPSDEFVRSVSADALVANAGDRQLNFFTEGTRHRKKPFCIADLRGAVLAFGFGRRTCPMETILVKIFATALALSQVTTAPDAREDALRPRPRSAAGRAALARGLHAYAQGLRHRGHQPRRPDRHRDGRSAGGCRREQGVSRHQFRRSANRLPAVLQEREGRRTRRSISAT